MDNSAVPIVKGTSLMIAYRLVDRPVLLIGGGNVASGRLFFLLEAGAKVTIIAPSPLDPSISDRLITNADDITYLNRAYAGRDDPVQPADFAMVLTAIDDNELSQTVFHMSREAHVPVNVADVPPMCDFYFGAQLRKGPLQVMVSTGGQGPKIGAMVRNIILDALPPNVEEAIEGVGKLRGDLRKRAPGVGGELGRKRMEWMIGMCDAWGLGEMEALRDDSLRQMVLDNGWDKGMHVVTPEEAGVKSWGHRLNALAEKVGSLGIGSGALITGVAIGSLTTLFLSRSR